MEQNKLLQSASIPVIGVEALGESEDSSRIVEKGGSEGPMSVLERIDRAFKNRLLGKAAQESPSNKIV
jgi:hypothetical protein